MPEEQISLRKKKRVKTKKKMPQNIFSMNEKWMEIKETVTADDMHLKSLLKYWTCFVFFYFRKVVEEINFEPIKYLFKKLFSGSFIQKNSQTFTSESDIKWQNLVVIVFLSTFKDVPDKIFSQM